MSREDEFEKLIEGLGQCLDQARALGLQHTIHLLSMTVMEVTDRSLDRPGTSALLAKRPSRQLY
jgi:hypothetical protein